MDMNTTLAATASASEPVLAGVFRSLAAPPDVLELLPMAVYACDADGRLLWFNQRAARLWGRSPPTGEAGELFCGAHRLHVEGRAVDRAESPMARVLATGEAIDGVDGLVERPDGSSRRVTVRIAPAFAADGKVVGAIACLTDTTASQRAKELVLTRSKQAERAAIDSQEQLRSVLDALPAAVYTTDAEGRITYYNQAAVDLAGRRPQLGTDSWCVSWRLYWPDGTPLPHDECPMAMALKEGRPIRNMEIIAERPDGMRVPVVPYPTPLRDGSGRIVGAVNMLVDISERRHAETQQRMMLDELNHRIKNNMHMLHSLLSAAQSETTSEDARAVLADASQRVAAMAAAQRVLYGSRNPAQFNAKDFLEAVCRTTEETYDQARIACEATATRLPNDWAVPLALILNELLTNAVKYGTGNRPGGTIRVGFTSSEASYDLYVEDDGPGFDLGAVRRRSSGLGLVSGLARQLGGRFSVERMPGARCSVRLPA
jgi:PAS domain S-box-containing protein